MAGIRKDPKELAALVEEHNRRVETTNSGQLTAVRALEGQAARGKAERDNILDAIRAGGAGIASLVEALKQAEAAIGDIEQKLSDARASLQPILRLRTLEDYTTGDTPIFSGDLSKDGALLRDLVEAILVYPNGTLSVRFRPHPLLRITKWVTGSPREAPHDRSLARERRAEIDFSCLVDRQEEAELAENVNADEPATADPSASWKTTVTPPGIEPGIST